MKPFLLGINMITQEKLKELVFYDKQTGTFTFLVTRGGMTAGKPCGGKAITGYIKMRINNKHYLAHRLAWLYVYGKWPDGVIDHIDHDTTNNRIDNLRDVSSSENQHNQLKKQAGNHTSNFIGVHFNTSRNKYISAITVKRKKIWLGEFDNELDAHHSYVEAKKKYHPTAPINKLR